MGRFLIFISVFAAASTAGAFTVVGTTPRKTVTGITSTRKLPTTIPLQMAGDQRDASRSGTKRDRLDKLAELEDSRVDTDKGFVVKAAGAFAVLIAILLVVAFTTLEGPI